jgi:hypothetical protein
MRLQATTRGEERGMRFRRCYSFIYVFIFGQGRRENEF